MLSGATRLSSGTSVGVAFSVGTSTEPVSEITVCPGWRGSGGWRRLSRVTEAGYRGRALRGDAGLAAEQAALGFGGRRLRQLRAEVRLTQEELAEPGPGAQEADSLQAHGGTAGESGCASEPVFRWVLLLGALAGGSSRWAGNSHRCWSCIFWTRVFLRRTRETAGLE